MIGVVLMMGILCVSKLALYVINSFHLFGRLQDSCVFWMGCWDMDSVDTRHTGNSVHFRTEVDRFNK